MKKTNLKFLLAVLLIALSSVVGHFNFQLAEVKAQDVVLSPSENGRYSKVIQRSEPFNTILLTFQDEVEGLMINTDPLHSDVWRPVEVHDDGFGVEAVVFFSPTKLIQFRQANKVEDELKFNAEFLFFDSENTHSIYGSGPLLGLANADVISRSAWGADESLRYWTPELEAKYKDQPSGSDPCAEIRTNYPNEVKVARRVKFDDKGEFIWPLSYMSSVKKFAVHHTDSEIRDLNGDQHMDSRDYEAMVKAIYYYHTVRRGWGDIGYHYIIDPLGNIYQGRYGGDKVIGAHALCHNNGTLGVALIGNYEDNEVPKPAMDALIRLLSEKAKVYNIDPKQSSSFRGKNLPNIFGHRDVRATSCPGEKLYGQLSRIRERASLALRLDSFNESSVNLGNLDFNAEFISGDLELDFLPNERKKITLAFKNTGKEKWDQNTWLHVALNNKKGARVIPVVQGKAFVAADLKEAQVLPGKLGHFEVELEAGFYGGYYQFEVAPVVNGRYKISRSSVFTSLSIEDPQLDYQLVKSSLPSGSFFQGQKVQASIRLKNTGNVVWQNYGKNPIRLGTLEERDRKSPLVNSSRIAHLLETEVAPGSTGTFVFDLEIPARLEGKVFERFAPVIEHVSWLDDKDLGFEIFAKKPTHRAQMVEKTELNELMPGERKKIDLTLKNKGDLEWSAENMRINLVASGLSLFKRTLRPEKTILPEDNGQFSFWVQAPYEEGKHRVSFSSKFNTKIIQGGISRYLIDVPKPRLRAQKVSQSESSVTIQPNQVYEVEVQYKNIGNTVWHKRGQNAIYLAPAQPQDRKSRLYYEDEWVSRFRAAEMVESEVGPGEIATFKLKINPQSKGVYREYFQLVIEKVGWIDSSNVRWSFRVFGDRIKESSSSTSELNINQERALAAIERRSAADSTDQIESNDSVVEKSSSEKIDSAKYATESDNDIRILLSYYDENSEISFDQPVTIFDGDSVWKEVEALQKISIEKINDKLYIKVGEKSSFIKVARFIPSARGIFTIHTMNRRPSWNPDLNDNQFRGSLEVRVLDGKVHFINELPLEDYMRGLAEVSNDTPIEKQKAIAVLARSYAQFYMSEENRKFPGKPYDGSDDPDVFQRYLGYGYEKRSPNFMSSIESTKGQVVTYRNKLIKTPYFNQSSGRTLSAKEVWGWTNTPYLVSVDDPYCKGLTQKGHGVGMSGCGADGMAKAGKSYKEIIKYYYNGVAIETFDN